ncbi:MAG: hypothetical protein IVW55_03835 [Chloroflexi bacterium]|nr:hypothetical protein [Chloroflexota bacterium]
MSLSEDVIREQVIERPGRYASRVRWIAVIYFVLNIISLVIIAIIAWKIRFFITLAQRSNVETLTIAIIFVLALYYLVATFRGFVGALRILWLNSPALMARTDKDRQAVERRKHSALKIGGDSKAVYLDKAVCVEGKEGEPIIWQVGDDAGKLGELALDGVRVTYYPLKEGMSNSLFEYLASQVEQAMQKRDLEAKLQITQWSSIDADEASAYYSMVQAFRNLEKQLDKGVVWPTVTITQEDVAGVQEKIRDLTPALRNESFLPDLEFAVEYNVPVIPEPLGFVRLTRNDNRADPVFTMGCAVSAMLIVMLVLTLFILLPPWLPSK